MNIFEIDPLQDSRWGSFVAAHPQASLYHCKEWLHALKLAYDYEPVAVTTSDPQVTLTNAIVFCQIRSHLTGNRLVSLPFSDHCSLLLDHSGDGQALIGRLTEMLGRKLWKYLELRPLTSSPDLKAALQQSFKISRTYVSHRLDLSRSEDTLFKSFHKNSVQRKIRRAERESLVYVEGVSDEILKQFYKLLIMTRRRHGLPPQPLRWFRALIASLGNDLKIRIALKGPVPVASILTISHGKTLVYKYGCSDVGLNNLGATQLLFWNAIREARQQGIEELDFGRSDLGNPGLITFKDHWGAERSTLQYWRYPPQAAFEPSEITMRLARKAVSFAPDSALVAIGNLLYRHIG